MLLHMPPQNEHSNLNNSEWLRKQYVDLQRLVEDIADECGCTKNLVYKRLRKYGIERRKHSSRYPLLNDKEWLRQKYVDERLSAKKIGVLAGGASPGNVHSHLVSAGIQLRDRKDSLRNADGKIVRRQSETRPAAIRETYRKKNERGEIKRGAAHPAWKGGLVKRNGYWMRYAPEHPRATASNPYAPEAVLIMEAKLGRFIDPKTENVHHINEDPLDNRLENLEVKTVSDHQRDHMKAKWERGLFGPLRRAAQSFEEEQEQILAERNRYAQALGWIADCVRTEDVAPTEFANWAHTLAYTALNRYDDVGDDELVERYAWPESVREKRQANFRAIQRRLT